MSREFIDAIELGKNLEAENAFKTAITTKIGDSLENKRKEISKSFVGKYEDQMYLGLSPKMRDAIDQIFKVMDSKPSEFLNTFDKTIKDVSKKFKVKEKDLMGYFEREMLSI